MKTAVITGGNGGLGRALAKRLQAEDWHTVLLDIDITDLETNAQQTPIELDLTDAEALAQTASNIIAARPGIDLVIYNAGITQIGALSDTPDTAHRTVFEINYFSAVNLARTMIAPLRKTRGIHLAISSVAGFAPLWHRSAYAASKHALQGFFTSLRSEEAPFGVRIVIAAPSFIATNIGNAEPRDGGIKRPGAASDGVDYMSPDTAAAAILRELHKRGDFIPVGRIARLAWWLNRLSPSLYQRLMERKFRR